MGYMLYVYGGYVYVLYVEFRWSLYGVYVEDLPKEGGSRTTTILFDSDLFLSAAKEVKKSRKSFCV